MRFRLRLMGPVGLTSALGQDVTPRSRKARGMLALLGTAPGLRMARARLQDLLWSQSPPAQGSASLRQTLHDLRHALDAALIGGDGWAGLDPAAVTVDLRPAPGLAGQPAEFAEGLEIDDPEFEDWLRDMRLALEDRAPARQLPLLIVGEPQGDSAQARMLAKFLLQEAAARAAPLIPARATQMAEAGEGLLVESWCLGQPDDRVLVMMVLRDFASGTQLWAQHYPLSSALHDLRRASGALAMTMIHTARQAGQGGWMLYPLPDLFSFSRSRLLAADRHLQQAEGAVPGALRAFLRYTLIIERQGADPRALLEEAEAHCRRAFEAAPGDPIVLAICSLMRSWRGEVAGALDLARLACRLSPGHDMAHLALSQALNDAGRDSDALTTILRADAGPMAVLGQASWQMRRAVAQLRLGRLAEAEAAAATALAYAP
ncbi:SARP family transcriptional regulator, partial [Paracoccus liaowanqingii]